MKFHRVPVTTISRRLDETVRIPTLGILDDDYLIKDENGEEAAKARVREGVIVVFAIRDDLQGLEREKALDILLRVIVLDADYHNANLSIEIKAEGLDQMEMIRFFERFGFRRVSDTIMKRNAGSIHPTMVLSNAGPVGDS